MLRARVWPLGSELHRPLVANHIHHSPCASLVLPINERSPSGDDPFAPATVFAIFAFLRGIGNIASGPVSDALLRSDILRGAAGSFGFKNYGCLLLWTAGTIFSGGLAGIAFKD